MALVIAHKTLADPELSNAAKLVAAATRPLPTPPSLRTLARLTGLSKSTISTAQRELAERGHATVEWGKAHPRPEKRRTTAVKSWRDELAEGEWAHVRSKLAAELPTPTAKLAALMLNAGLADDSETLAEALNVSVRTAQRTLAVVPSYITRPQKRHERDNKESSPTNKNVLTYLGNMGSFPACKSDTTQPQKVGTSCLRQKVTKDSIALLRWQLAISGPRRPALTERERLSGRRSTVVAG